MHNILNNMKTKVFYFILFLIAGVATACQKHDFAAGELSPIIAVRDVRALYKGTDVTLNKTNMLGATQIVGTVISNPDSGNAPVNLVVLQNSRSTKISGISLPMGALSTGYKAGDSLVVTVENKTLTRVNGLLQITGLTAADVRKVSEGNKVTPLAVSSFNIKAKPDLYESTLVQVKSANVAPVPQFGETLLGEKFLVNGADSLTLHTEATAHFAGDAIPATATFAGILLVNGQDAAGKPVLQLWPRLYSDISDKTQPADPNAAQLESGDIVITGIISDVKGADGNYEYFQFRATRNIDFSKTPASVITCTNAGTAAPNAGDAPGAGWITGGGRTYKFNLTNGIVNKGDFFYVGGSNKKINGANSTDISTAKWIRAIAYVTNDGDGFGSASAGLLPNSGNAGGVAVFSGITLEETTTPMDVVFFGGSGKTTIYNATTNKGYRIPLNDRYSPLAADGVTAQPFMFQGTNTYIFAHPTTTDVGYFMKLGGRFDMATKKWITPRANTFYTLTATSNLSEIETGTEVTVLQ